MTLIRRFALLLFCTFSVLGAEEVELDYAPSPVDNPLRGMVPYLSSLAPASVVLVKNGGKSETISGGSGIETTT